MPTRSPINNAKNAKGGAHQGRSHTSGTYDYPDITLWMLLINAAGFVYSMGGTFDLSVFRRHVSSTSFVETDELDRFSVFVEDDLELEVGHAF